MKTGVSRRVAGLLVLVVVTGAGCRATSEAPSAVSTRSPPVVSLPSVEVDEVAGAVADIRELDFRRRPEVVVLPDAQRVQRWDAWWQRFYESYEQDTDAAWLEALRAIPSGYDFASNYRLKAAAFYDSRTNEVVLPPEDEWDQPDYDFSWLVAHEFAHALTLNRFEIPWSELSNPSRALAHAALVEGDAELAEQLFANSRGDRWRAWYEDPRAEVAALPHFLRRQFEFPYREGRAFVEALHHTGGWEQVNEAWRTPPTTTWEILHPDRYLDRSFEPVEPARTGLLSLPWAPALKRTFGAAELLFLFEAPAGDVARGLDDPAAAVAAWRGGRLEVWRDDIDDRTAVVVALAGDLCDQTTTWLHRTFADTPSSEDPTSSDLHLSTSDGHAALRCTDRQVVVAIAPDTNTVDQLLPP